jgi:1-acyl-sn-glycerol-3-phosphate acyltransferase
VRPGKIEIKIGEPIETKDLTLKDRPFLMEKVRGAIQKNLDPPNDRETKEV